MNEIRSFNTLSDKMPDDAHANKITVTVLLNNHNMLRSSTAAATAATLRRSFICIFYQIASHPCHPARVVLIDFVLISNTLTQYKHIFKHIDIISTHLYNLKTNFH